MHRLARSGVATLAALALTLPALTSPADATSAQRPASAAVHAAAEEKLAEKKPAKIKLTRSSKGVQPGGGTMRISALRVSGKVRFVVRGAAGKVRGSARARHGKATYKVPALGTGTYAVTATAKGRRPGRTTFEVYDSVLSVTQTTYTYSLATPCTSQPHLSGSIRFKGEPAAAGYADVYEDGRYKGGLMSPGYLAFATVRAGGTFDESQFVCQVVQGAGNTDAKGPGTYSFNVYYTDSEKFADYISSNTIVVNVTA